MKTLFIAALLSLAVVVPANAVTPRATLTGKVGPGFTITLKKGTKKVTTLKVGLYRFVIYDKSNIHNFRLIGPVGSAPNNKRYNRELTEVGYHSNVPKTYEITLKPGTWKYQCDPHKSTMHGSFTVTR
jgi:plastocyanin